MTATGVDRITEIERLAALDPVNYEAIRVDKGKQLGMRQRILDQEVAKRRRALGLESGEADPGQGRAIKIPDVLPWPDPVEGDHVASALAAALKNYVVLSDLAADAVALWVLHTWAVNKFTISPDWQLPRRPRAAARQPCCDF
jgi:hypothetical protein